MNKNIVRTITKKNSQIKISNGNGRKVYTANFSKTSTNHNRQNNVNKSNKADKGWYSSKSFSKSLVYSSKYRNTKRKINETLKSQDDSGSQTLATAITAGDKTIKTFIVLQHTSPHIIRAASKNYHSAVKTSKVIYRTGKNVSRRIRNGIRYPSYKYRTYKIKASHTMGVKVKRLHKAFKNISPHIIKGNSLNYSHSFKYSKTIYRTPKAISKNSKSTRKKISTKKILKSSVTKGKGLKSLSTNIKKQIQPTIRKSRARTIKLLGYGMENSDGNFTKSDDIGVQAIGYNLKITRHTTKAIIKAPQVSKNTFNNIKRGVNTTNKARLHINNSIKKTRKASKQAKHIINKYGTKNALNYYKIRWNKSIQKNVRNTVVQAGNSIVTALLNITQKMFTKTIFPLLLALLLVVFGTSLLSNFGAAISSVFSPFLSDDSGNEVDETQWLTAHITTKRNSLIKDIKDTYNKNLVVNGGNYHYVRFYNAFNDSEIDLTDNNINTSIYSVSEYQEYIQPIFHTIILSDYDLEASESEMEELLNNLWDKLSSIKTEELPIEYCGGSGAGVHYADISTCPNYSDIQYHSDDSSPLNSCDYWYYTCNGLPDGTVLPGELASSCGNSTRHKGCNGYYICKGHRILSLSVKLNNFGDLLKEYYTDEINNLKSKASLTVNERKRLQDLTDYYEICINYTDILTQEMGYGNEKVVNLDGVTLTDITDFASQYIGNPYVWGGNDPNNGIDCSGFTKYVYSHFGLSLPRTANEQVKVGVTIADISLAQPGDLIFYSDDGTDSGVYHVTIYLGNNKMIHASNSKPYPNGGIKVSNLYGTVYKIKRVAN